MQVRALAKYLKERRQAAAAALRYEVARVLAVRPVGMGDRACVDLCRWGPCRCMCREEGCSAAGC